VTDPGLQSLLIPAVGGQGGGVLAEWIVEAAAAEGCRAHGTSIPGVAQRTGSTTYYVEVCRDDAAPGDGPEPVFSLYPVPGALDVLLAPELLEVGRMIELGFPSPARTTIIASTHRLYSIHEKIATGRGIYPGERLEDGARAFSRRLIAFDALAVAREQGTEVNAVLLGALAGSGVLPISVAAFRKAIEAKGVGVEANLRGFEAGMAVVTRIDRGEGVGATPSAPTTSRSGAAPTPSLTTAGAAALADPGIARALLDFPARLRPTLETAVERLVDYQDTAYAARYLERLRPVLEAGDPEVLTLVARHLAVWMTYEDAIRVADLKTRAGRLERIRRDARAGDGEVVVTDYLKPDLDELYGILPRRLVAPLARWAERRWPHGRPTLGQHVRTTTVTGYLRLWLLARLRWLRPVSYRAHHEHARMERWLGAVRDAAGSPGDLAAEIARAAGLVKGYGDVRRRMAAVFDHLLERVGEARRLEAAGGGLPGVAAALARTYRTLVLRGPEREAEAARLADRVVERLRAADHAGARALLDERPTG
jgi:indolepyruvate ferredoxin oxidoreductase beta subunit